MDDLDHHLRERLERLAEGVPIAASVRLERVRRARPGIRPSVAAAVAAVVVLAATTGLLGVSALRQSLPAPAASTVVAPSPSEAGSASVAANSTAPLPSATPTPTLGLLASTGPSADRYDDGIPKFLGNEPVLRGADALARAARASHAGDASSFLVGGWVTRLYGVFSCPLEMEPRGWGSCGQPSFSDVAGSWDNALSQAIVWKFLSQDGQPITGPAVVKVHVGDPRASECAHPELCAAQMVVSDVEWAGDDRTAPGPISAAAALAAVSKVDGNARLVEYGPGVANNGCSEFLPGFEVYLTTGDTSRMPEVMSFTIGETAPALTRSMPAFPEGAAGVWTDKAWLSDAGSGGTVMVQCRRLRVANILVVVQLHPGSTAADRAFVVRLAAALEAAR